MKTNRHLVFHLVVVSAFTCCLAGALISHVRAQTTAVSGGGSEGGNSIAVAYGANNTAGSTCTGPAVPCGAGPSPDCSIPGVSSGGGICAGITSITNPTCTPTAAWIGEYSCYQNGMECQNGTCSDGASCFNTVAGACTDDWWWF